MLAWQLTFLSVQLLLNAMAIYQRWKYPVVYFIKAGWILFPVLSILLTCLYFNSYDIPESQKSYVSGTARCGNGELGYILVQYGWLLMASFVLQIICDVVRYFTSKTTIVEKY